jgi:hypothetical protein
MNSRDPSRLYEITDVHEDHIWWSEWNSSYDIRGTIIQISNNSEWPHVEIVKENKRGFPSSRVGSVTISMEGLRLRPLTQKETKEFQDV